MSDNLEVAKEPDAYLCLDDSGKPYACKLTVEAGEKYIPLYTSRVLASQQAAHEAEIARLRASWDKVLDEAGKAVYAANAACAMKDAALKVANAMLVEQESALRQMGCDEPNAEPAIIQVRDALSASQAREAESREKILELGRRVKVLTDALEPFVREARDYVSDGNKQLIKMVRDGERALNQTPQQTAAQIERWHIEWMMKLPVEGYKTPRGAVYGGAHGGKLNTNLVAIPPLPKESDSPGTDLEEWLRRQ